MVELFETLRVKPGPKFRLTRIDPDDDGGVSSKKEARELLLANIKRLNELQYLLYAEDRRSVLVVLQGIDAAGKDGTIRHVMSGLNPQGCRVVSFKKPAGVEQSHDFLWRIHKAMPRFGEIGIFNRSHYEDVLVVRVHNLIPESDWCKRYQQINDFERMLTENGVTIVKFFLYISEDEQKKRFQARLEDPRKNWKISEADFSERKHWPSYMEAFEEMLRRCHTPYAPWFVIPSNRKWFRNLAASEILVRTLEQMRLKLPAPSIDLSKFSFV
jgi:PPK2 family polyphosphate:nucleotide phosphotransferase